MKYLLPLLAVALLLGGALPKDFTAQDAIRTQRITITQHGIQFDFLNAGYYIEWETLE